MGVAASLISHALPPKPKFSVDDIPDLSGKIIIVTGGSSGIGKETVKALLLHNAKVYLAARGAAKGQQAIDELKATTGKEAIFLELDLGSLHGVKKAAETFLTMESELHVLFNNAGIMCPPIEQLTSDGYDMQFGIHVVGHHLFTQLLIPALRAGAQTSSDNKARVVTTSSNGAYFTSSMHWDTLIDGPARNSRSPYAHYFQSKFAQIVWARELARRYANQGIIFVSLHPGSIKTELYRHTSPSAFVQNLLFYPLVPYGALTQLWGGTSPEILNHNGKFLIPWARVGKPPAGVDDPETGLKLWTWLEDEIAKKGLL